MQGRLCFLFVAFDLHAFGEDGEVRAESATEAIAVTRLFVYDNWRMVSSGVKLRREAQGTGGTKLDAEAATFAQLLIDMNNASKLSFPKNLGPSILRCHEAPPNHYNHIYTLGWG